MGFTVDKADGGSKFIVNKVTDSEGRETFYSDDGLAWKLDAARKLIPLEVITPHLPHLDPGVEPAETVTSEPETVTPLPAAFDELDSPDTYFAPNDAA
jgi:hypothetical protein